MKRAGVVLVLLLWSATAQAHKPSDSYLTLSPSDIGLSGEWSIALRDLDHAIGLDADEDGAITWKEVRQRQDVIAAYALGHLTLQSGAGRLCVLTPVEHLIDRYTDGAYAVLRFTAACNAGDHVSINYRLFFDLDPQHRGIVRVGVARDVYLFTADTPNQRVAIGQLTTALWRAGLRRALDLEQIGFVLALLGPGLFTRDRRDRRELAKLLLAFVVSHALTLSLATLHSIALDARAVTVGIATMAMLAALSHAVRALARQRWLIAAGFGLLHGFDLAVAFAGSGATVAGLLTFNAGIALGQGVTIVLIGSVVGSYPSFRRKPESRRLMSLSTPAMDTTRTLTCGIAGVGRRNHLPGFRLSPE